MKKLLFTVCIIFFSAGLVIADEAGPLKDQKDKVSYSLGVTIGKSMKRDSIDANPDLVARGIKDVLSGEKILLTDEQMAEVFMAMQQELMTKKAEARKALAEKNLKEGEQFLAENAKKEGVVTRPSGLQYKVVTEGTGKTAKNTDTITVHYRVTGIDGTEFDSSYMRNEPTTFQLQNMIPGFTEAITLMKVGSKYQFFIPSKLAYGEEGAEDTIGPNAALLFDVELLEAKEAPKAKDAPVKKPAGKTPAKTTKSVEKPTDKPAAKTPDKPATK